MKIKIKTRKPARRVPPEAIHIYDKLTAIEGQGLHLISEECGGRKREWNKLNYRLCDLMRCERWQGSPMDCQTELIHAPDYVQVSAYKSELWQRGYQAFRVLERASRAGTSARRGTG